MGLKEEEAQKEFVSGRQVAVSSLRWRHVRTVAETQMVSVAGLGQAAGMGGPGWAGQRPAPHCPPLPCPVCGLLMAVSGLGKCSSTQGLGWRWAGGCGAPSGGGQEPAEVSGVCGSGMGPASGLGRGLLPQQHVAPR